jgi:hypothetical protein
MNIPTHRSLSLMLAAAAFTFSTATGTARIDGLNAFEPVSANSAVPVVVDETMHINLPDGRKLAVAPWPAFLPQRFGEQTVTGTREMHPAGPVDRLSFARSDDPRPWLVIGNGARRASSVIGNWRLQLSRQRWSLSDGKMRTGLAGSSANARPALIRDGTDRWCVYLLDTAMPATQPNIAVEGEPQVAWVAIKLHPLQKRCRTAK